MAELTITEIEVLEKGKRKVTLDNGEFFLLYWKEIRQLGLEEGVGISMETYEHIVRDILGLRAKRRAMHILEKMDRTEWQLRDKLKTNRYPEEAIEIAIDYVKRFHYIDDFRYACTYIRMGQEKKSCQRLKMDLRKKGIDRDILNQALEQEFEADERKMIRELLVKKHYDAQNADQKETQRIYNFLLRRGFKSPDILKVMKMREDF